MSNDTRNSLPLSISPQILQNYALFVLSRAKPMGGLTANLHHATTGMTTEAGEALSTTKKMWVYGQDLHTVNKEGKTNRQNLLEEGGDALFYLQMLCNLLGITLLDLIAANEAKLRLRYPETYSDSLAAARLDKDQRGQTLAEIVGEDIDKACREN
jgi:NTP pyrophosphatase (non-canonical NTP hydrolase)